MPTRGLAVLSYDLPAGSSGDVVRLYLLTRRPDGVGGWVYSAHLGFKTLSVDTSAGGAETTPPGGDRWTGRIPER